MTAHLAIAQALRPSGAESPDGRLARVVHAALVGLQRDALALLAGLDTADASAAERAWVRALTLRITGDWRPAMHAATATRLELFEQARALATRMGSAALMDWLDTFEQDADPAWHRIALGTHSGHFTLEASAVYSRVALDREVSETRQMWSALHEGRALADSHLVAALNEAAEPGSDRLLPWVRWAASAQRHVAMALTARAFHHRQRGNPESGQQHVADSTGRFASLTLFPLVLRSMALDAATYGRSLREARRLVAEHPENVTATAWNLLTERPPV